MRLFTRALSIPHHIISGRKIRERLLESRWQALMSVDVYSAAVRTPRQCGIFFHPAGLFAGVCCPDDYDGRDNIPHHPQGKSCKNITDVYDRNQRVIHNQFKEEEKWQRIRDLKRFIHRER